MRLSFSNDPEVLVVTVSSTGNELALKWEVAVQLVALMHVLVLQNMILRSEDPVLRTVVGGGSFEVRGGMRASTIVCAWKTGTAGIEVNSAPDPEVSGQQVELVLSEGVAIELLSSLAERIARNGTSQRTGEHRL